MRIVLSTLLSLSLLACTQGSSYDDDPQVANGIGTSPSEPLAGSQAELQANSPCGVWFSHDGMEDAEVVSLERGPDVVVLAQPGGLSCAWAFQLSALVWPGRSFIRPWR